MNRKMALPAVVLALLATGCDSTSKPAAVTLATSLSPAASATGAPALPTASPAVRVASPTAPPVPVEAHAKPTGACGPGDLTLTQTGSQGTAGSRHADFTVTRQGPGQCTVTGWPSVTPVDATGRPVRITQTHTGIPTAVAVARGHPARFDARVSLLSCNTDPVAAPHADITLPGATRSVKIALSSLPVCPGGAFEISALQN